MGVSTDNVATVSIGGREYGMRACLGAGVIYANQFLDETPLDPPYKGELADDMLEVYRRAQPVVGEDGETPVAPGRVDAEALVRLMWAMCRAAGSTAKGYEDFAEEVYALPASVSDEAALYATVILKLGGGVIFRDPQGQSGGGEVDEKSEQGEGQHPGAGDGRG